MLNHTWQWIMGGFLVTVLAGALFMPRIGNVAPQDSVHTVLGEIAILKQTVESKDLQQPNEDEIGRAAEVTPDVNIGFGTLSAQMLKACH